MALKKCYKLHKIFLTELERCERIEREGTQVLSSLANVAKRVPLLTEDSGVTSQSSGVISPFGVLDYIPDTSARLLEKHFLAMEKSASFLRDIIRDFADAVRRLRGFVEEFVELVDEVSLVVVEGDEKAKSTSAVGAALTMLEWMENVRTMYEREALRKRLLVADVEYWDVSRLQRMHREWPATANVSFIGVDYVNMGTEELPPLPVISSKSEEDNMLATSESTSSKSKKKKKKQAKTG